MTAYSTMGRGITIYSYYNCVYGEVECVRLTMAPVNWDDDPARCKPGTRMLDVYDDDRCAGVVAEGLEWDGHDWGEKEFRRLSAAMRWLQGRERR